MSKSSNKNNYQKIDDIRRLIKEGNYKKALYKIVNYVADNPNDAVAHYIYGKLLMRQNNLKSAKHEFQLAVDKHGPKEVKSLMALATIAKQEGSTEEAMKYYNQAVKISGYKNVYAIHSLAQLLRIEKRYEEALETLSLVCPPVMELQIEKVKNLSQLGRFEEALAILETMTTSNREEALNKGKQAKEKDEYEKAKFYFEAAQETAVKDETYYKALYEQVKLAILNKDYQEAIDCCEELSSADKIFDGEIYLLRGRAKQALAQHNEAYEDYQLATEISTCKQIRSSAYYYKGSIEFARGDLHFAEVSFKKSIANSKEQAELTYVKLIGVLLRQKKYGEVKKYLNSLNNNSLKITSSIPLSLVEMLVDKHTGKKMPRRDSLSYAQRQVIEYKEKDAIEHIRAHHQNGRNVRGKFSKDIEIESLFYELKNELTDDKLINEEIMDIYELDFPYVGYDLEHDLVHKVRVVVFPNTKKILTMYPGCRATVPQKSEFLKTKGVQKSKIQDLKNQ